MNPFRPHLSDIEDVIHGGAAQLAAAGLDVDPLTDFSATTLPGGPPAPVREALARVPLERYPDPHASALRAALARHHALRPGEILPANGAAELIGAIALAALGPGDRALVVGPTFGEYARATRIAGAEVQEIRTSDARKVLAAIETWAPRLVFLCNPNNPTGQLWDGESLAAFAEAAFLVVDEAYAGFLDPDPGGVVAFNRLTLRSLTKDCGLAGLRLGYAIGTIEVLEPLKVLLTPWGVNSLAQAAGIAAVEAYDQIRARVRDLFVERDRLVASLRTQGWDVDARKAPFFLVRVGEATSAARRLLETGLVVRDASSFGLPEWIRISPQHPRDNDRLVAAMAELPRPGPAGF